MPGKAGRLQKVHVANSMQQLNEKTYINASTLNKSPPERLARTASKCLEEAEKYECIGDEENAYIHYMKYLHIAQHVQKCVSANYKQYFDNAKLSASLHTVEQLCASLKERYDLLKMAIDAEKPAKIASELESSRPKSPVAPNAAISSMNGIQSVAASAAEPEDQYKLSSRELYNLMSKYRGNRGLLVMDVRSKKDYAESRLDAPCIINVPEDILQSGKSSSWIEKHLPNEAMGLWKERGAAEYVVLMDWSSKLSDVIPSSKLHLLRNILEKWDVRTFYKRKPLILEGGYEDLLSAYPYCTTNPNVIPPIQDNSLDDMLLDNIEYPAWTETTPPTPSSAPVPNIDRGLKPSMVTVSSIVSAQPETKSSVDIKESEVTVKQEVEKDRVTSLQRPLVVNSQQPSIPTVDRTTKQLAIEKMERDKQRAIEEVNKLQSQKENKEREINLLYLNSVVEADKKKETELRAQIANLEKLCKEQEEEKVKLQKKLDEANKTEREEKLQHPKSAPAITSLPSTTATATTIDKSVPSPKVSKSTSPPISGSNRAPSAVLPGGRTTVTPMADRDKKPSSGEPEQLKFEALKLDGPSSGGGLTRSHSSPNINNMDDAIPFFDRSTKPNRNILSNEHFNHRRDFSPVYGSKGRGLTGLKNLGNSCYMNSIVQCISNTRSLNEYFCGGSYRDDVCPGTRTRGQIVEELAAVLRTLWTGEYRAIACKDFKRVAGFYHEDFAGYRQQDSHEFLTLLMDWLHGDLNKRRNMKPPASPSTDPLEEEKKNQNLELAASIAWKEFKQCNESRIQQYFYGQQSSTVSCKKCYFKSVTFEPFSSLTLVLPGERDKCFLTDCLDIYLAPEDVSEWKCPKCNTARPASKKFDIWRLPPILIIHFKRFYEDVLWRKQHTLVDFPLRMLDMRQFTTRPDQQHTTYDLYAVSNHYGTMDGGHYTTYSLSPANKKWYKFDDADVSEISDSQVRSNAAYILFYASTKHYETRHIHSAS